MTILAIVRDQLARNKEGLIGRLTRNSARQPKRFDQEVGCLLWTAHLNNDGYPTLNIVFDGKHRQIYVHHLTLALSSGKELPEGMERDHKCNNRACIEPRCLEIVTHAVNLKRARERRMVKWSLAQAGEAMRQQET